MIVYSIYSRNFKSSHHGQHQGYMELVSDMLEVFDEAVEALAPVMATYTLDRYQAHALHAVSALCLMFLHIAICDSQSNDAECDARR